MSLFKKFTKKFNKKEHITREVKINNKIIFSKEKEIENVSLNTWPEIKQNFDIEYGYEEGDGTPFEEIDGSTSLMGNEADETALLPTDEEKPSKEYLLELVLLILIPCIALFSRVLMWIPFALLLWRVKFLLIKVRLADGDYIEDLDPFEINFSQASINNVFQMGNDIENTIEDLVDKKIKIEDFPYIRVCQIDDMWYSSDNRRLYCFQESIRRGLEVKKIPVQVRRASDLNIKWKIKGAYRIVKVKNFKNIVVSPHATNGRVIDHEGYWDYFE